MTATSAVQSGAVITRERGHLTRAMVLTRRVMGTAARRVVGERSGLAVIGLFYLLVTAVLGSLWLTAANANGGSIAGYSTVAIVWYIATTESGTISVPMRLIEDIGLDISSGQVAAEMQRPVSVLWMRVLTEVGTCLPRLLLCLSVGTVFALAVVGAPPDATTLPLAAISIVLAVTLNLIAQHLFAGAAFWLSDAKSTWFLYQKLVFILGGMLLPIEVLPDGLEAVARFLPFVAMAYAPARLASGHFEPWLVALQLGWIVLAAAGATWLYRRGERRIMRVG